MKKLITAVIVLLFTVNVNATETDNLITDIMSCSTTIYQIHDIQCASDIVGALSTDFEFPTSGNLRVILNRMEIPYDVFVVSSITVQYAATCGNIEELQAHEAPICAMFLDLLFHEHN